MVRNCVTNTTLLSIKRYGATDFLNDGAFDAATETYYTDVGLRVIGILLKYNKIVDNACVEMTQEEKDTVDAEPMALNLDYHFLRYPAGVVETLTTTPNEITIHSYATKITVNNLILTMNDGDVEFQAKLIQTQGGTCTVTCSLKEGFSSVTLDNNSKIQLMWHNGWWHEIDSKGITFNV